MTNTMAQQQCIDMAQVAERLEQEMASTRHALDRMEHEVIALTRDNAEEGGSARNHMGDEGSNDYERERIISLQEEMRSRLNLIEQARQALDDGTYGTCRRCGNPIPLERLEVMPFALFDVECQQVVDEQADPHAGFSSEQRTGDGVNA